ncbi:zinc metalloprotease HtpX [Granulicella cerasi]|uniref:Zinc metalloprotease HtpX n=1 Tax=Granulicella cerasi TaxID=741063 RepID=A0ABW1Z9C7_9BACT|nr:zinc metalloprotease HtpX [Granulicella cerasi]
MSFLSRSLLILVALYGFVFVLGDVFLLHQHAPVWSGLVFVLVLAGVQYAISPWLIERFYNIGWYEGDIPQEYVEFVREVCAAQNMPMPNLGIIESETPNAFAFGRLQKDARVVVTRGLLNILSPEEVKAVLAHELGHIAHYDFAAMTLAAVAPMLLYQIYLWTDRMNNQGRIVSYCAYVAYWIGQFMVLLLNRTREYGADAFSAEITGDAPALSSALVKIAYGMVKYRGELRRLEKEGDSSEKKQSKRLLQAGQALGIMGIASVSDQSALALGYEDPAATARVMKWDLVNPWARFYELGSTHPLTALRLRALNRIAEKNNQPVQYPLPATNGMRWIGFPIEFAIWSAPLVLGFLLVSYFWVARSLEKMGLNLPVHLVGWMLISMGITWAIKIMYRYRGNFTPAKVETLLEDLDVSQMRSRAVVLEGEVIGHGNPGAFWSPDLVLRDDTGMMFLLYRSSIPFGRFVFALSKADSFIGERVRVEGWYRRGLMPYFEMSKIQGDVIESLHGRGPVTLFGTDGVQAPVKRTPLMARSYARWIQLGAAAVATVVGITFLQF